MSSHNVAANTLPGDRNSGSLATSMDISLVTEPLAQDLEKYEIPLQVPSSTNEAPYSYYTKPQKRLIIILITFAGLFSTLSSFIYFPAVTSLSSSLNVSV
ncbi:hypothetical protein V491_03309 [Pseudogymnoascus sp. VKM F-3775]|nr:hypothetical protein V491_03309 [Pseudogymnoascus sp. VKM F-3775]